MMKRAREMWAKCSRCNKYFHNKSVGLLLLRLSLGSFFLVHGISKLQNMDSVVAYFNSIGLVTFWAYVVSISEIIVGLTLILGIFLWVAAFLLTVMSIVAIYKVTGPNPQGQTFLIHYISSWGSNLIYATAAICIASCGAGRWSLNALWMRRMMKDGKDDMCVDCKADHGLGHNCPNCPSEHQK